MVADDRDFACVPSFARDVGRVIPRRKRGLFRAVADYGQKGGRTVRTAKLQKRITELFEQGHGPRGVHRVVAKLVSYGTVHSMYAEWLAGRAVRGEVPPAPQQEMPPTRWRCRCSIAPTSRA